MLPRAIVSRTCLYFLVISSAAALLFSACARRPAKVRVVHPAGAQVVVIKKGHRHSANCGHYRHGNKWYYVKGHAHGRKCGHHKVDGIWVVKI